MYAAHAARGRATACRAAPAGPRPPSAAALRGERPARRAPALHEPGDGGRLRRAVGVAQRHRRARAPGAAARGRRAASVPLVPGAAAGAGRGSSRPRGHGREAPRAFRAEEARGVRGVPGAPGRGAPPRRCRAAGGRPSSAAWAQRERPPPRVPARRRRARACALCAGSHGFTPQYSNQVTGARPPRAVADRHVVEQQRVVAERRVHVLADREPAHGDLPARVAGAEDPLGASAGRAVGIERADRPAARAQPAEAAGVLAVRGRVAVDPLVHAVLAPELRVAVVVGVGDHVVVAELGPGVGWIGHVLELGAARARVARLVDPVAVRREAPAVLHPAAEDAAPVARAGRLRGCGERRGGQRGEHDRCSHASAASISRATTAGSS